MRFGSVCSGIEAASQAWPFWQAAWFSEIEPFPCAVLAHHYPSVSNHGDMTLLPERILSGDVEAPDVFCGVTPCQAFSVAGNRRSLDDARGNLSLTFCEIADAIDSVRAVRGERAAIIFWENVPGVLNTKDNAFGCFLAGLAGEDVALEPPGGKWTDAGYVFGPARAVAWRVLDAKHFGLAQRRKRCFAVASARDGFNPAEVLFEFDGVRRDTPPSREARQGIAADVAGGAGDGLARCITTGEAKRQDWETCNIIPHPVCAEISPTVTNGPPFSRTDERVECEALVAVPVIGFENSRRDGVRLYDGVTHTLQSFMGTGGGNTPCVATLAPPHAFKIRGGCEGGGKGYLGQDEQAFTITTGHDQQVAVPCAYPINTLTLGGRPDPVNDARMTLGVGADGDPQFTLQAAHCHAVAYIGGIDYENNAHTMDQPTGPLLKGSPTGGGRPLPAIMTQYAVRRLTPTECERLQGFPDGYTNIPWRNKPEAPDGPRYKALGNSWAVPVVRWIGERIEAACQ